MRRWMLATRGRADRPWRLARACEASGPARPVGQRRPRRDRRGPARLAIAWPRLAPPPPRLPSDAGVPVAPPRLWPRASAEGPRRAGAEGGASAAPRAGRRGAAARRPGGAGKRGAAAAARRRARRRDGGGAEAAARRQRVARRSGVASGRSARAAARSGGAAAAAGAGRAAAAGGAERRRGAGTRGAPDAGGDAEPDATPAPRPSAPGDGPRRHDLAAPADRRDDRVLRSSAADVSSLVAAMPRAFLRMSAIWSSIQSPGSREVTISLSPLARRARSSPTSSARRRSSRRAPGRRTG